MKDSSQKLSRCGFVVAKVVAEGEHLYLMRHSKKWHDISFVGGHELNRDANKLSRTAYRELLEEVPPIRKMRGVKLHELTNELNYGPLFSPSAGQIVRYELQFFLLLFSNSPKEVIGSLGSRSPNVLMSERDLLAPSGYRIAGLVNALDRSLPTGLEGIPLSWTEDLGPEILALYRSQKSQFELPLSAHKQRAN